MKKSNKAINLGIFGDLIKYRLSLAVVLSSVTGYFICGNDIDIHLLYLSAGVFFLASASAALNQYSERKTDALMERTKNRPVPAGRISERGALSISLVLFLSGIITLFLNGLIPILLGLANVLLYNLIYTRLKKITILSIIPGGVVGAIPPMIGYSSAGGDLTSPEILAFSAFMFLWQLPHFWLLIIKYGKEYRDAGLATISSYMSESGIRILVFFWVVVSNSLITLFFMLADTFEKPVLAVISILNIAFIILFYRLLFARDHKHEIKGAFILINSFSILFMSLLITVSLLNNFLL